MPESRCFIAFITHKLQSLFLVINEILIHFDKLYLYGIVTLSNDDRRVLD
jgi:hypothetical protein